MTWPCLVAMPAECLISIDGEVIVTSAMNLNGAGLNVGR
jgi:hypothetical protein